MEGLKFASLMNSGQACVAQTRILASRQKYDEVVEAVAEMVKGMSVGDPSDPATEIGPLVAQRQQERVEKYIALGQEEGASVVVGGNGMPAGVDPGWYVQPTVAEVFEIDPAVGRLRYCSAGHPWAWRARGRGGRACLGRDRRAIRAAPPRAAAPR